MKDQVTDAFDFVEFCFEKKLVVALVVGVILKREREINREQGGWRRDERHENQYRGRHRQCQPSCSGGGGGGGDDDDEI